MLQGVDDLRAFAEGSLEQRDVASVSLFGFLCERGGHDGRGKRCQRCERRDFRFQRGRAGLGRSSPPCELIHVDGRSTRLLSVHALPVEEGLLHRRVGATSRLVCVCKARREIERAAIGFGERDLKIRHALEGREQHLGLRGSGLGAPAAHGKLDLGACAEAALFIDLAPLERSAITNSRHFLVPRPKLGHGLGGLRLGVPRAPLGDLQPGQTRGELCLEPPYGLGSRGSFRVTLTAKLVHLSFEQVGPELRSREVCPLGAVPHRRLEVGLRLFGRPFRDSELGRS